MAKNWNELNKEDFADIERLAALLFTPREIATMLETEPTSFVFACDKEHEGQEAIYTSFQRGRLQAEVDLRTSILKLAKSGSSPAQMLAIDILNKSKQKMIDR